MRLPSNVEASQALKTQTDEIIAHTSSCLKPGQLLQSGACGAVLQIGRHASEAAGCPSADASTSGRTQNSGQAQVLLQHAWSLPASPHLAVAAEGERCINSR